MRGVMEVGSELQLQANGEFEYMLAYGALDEYATGCWSREGQTVTLVVSKFEANAEDPMKFERLELAINPGGKLVRRFDGGHSGHLFALTQTREESPASYAGLYEFGADRIICPRTASALRICRTLSSGLAAGSLP